MQINLDHIPDALSNNWSVETYTVSQKDADRFNALHPGREIAPGDYKRLVYRGGIFTETVMSNTPAEISDFLVWAEDVKGHILINGLGLGVLVTYLLAKPEVLSITVIEKSEDVLTLVRDYLPQDERLVIEKGDAFSWEPLPGERNYWDFIWHDIWPDICMDNLKEMYALLKKYQSRCEEQKCWSFPEIEATIKEETIKLRVKNLFYPLINLQI